MSNMGVSNSSSLGEAQVTSRERLCGEGGVADSKFTLKHLLLLAAIAAVLVGVFSLSTASRADLGHEAGAHLRSLARAHRIAHGDGPAIQIEPSAEQPITVPAEPVLLGRVLLDLDGVRKPATALAGTRISRAPPAPAA
jgi:hypothetical protein